ncbi:retrovirus-related pol polyprotein from transposon TNT 1-94 [Tanacetum coccineum]|uniref:Retrovirus-related pol polyprotein from transposon TNT 1-94 n=1 Tax=Tanacetum coccineum TaxID=301880 RepID=A0ABQ5IPY6_9ASTR
MTTLAEFMIIADAEKHPPMLETSLYDSWKSRIELYIENQENGRMILNSLQNGLLSHIDYQISSVPPIAYNSSQSSTQQLIRFPQIDSGLVVPMLNQGDNLIACLNKSKRPRNAAWFKEKAMLAESHESDQILDEEQLAFLADPGIPDGQAAQKTILNIASFWTEDLDAYDSNSDDVSNAKAVMMATLSNYSSGVISKVKFLISKDEAPEFNIKFLKMIQVLLNATIRNIRTYNGRSGCHGLLHPEPFPNTSSSWKTLYELLHDRKPDLSYLYVFGALCYPTNNSEDLGKLKAKADVGIFIRYAPAKKAYQIYNKLLDPTLHEMTLGTLSSGLMPQRPSATPFVPPTRNDWDTVLQPLFDEYFHPPPRVDHLVPKVAASEPTVSTGTPSSTSVDQDAPSTKPSSEESSSQVVIPNNVHSLNQPPEHISKWTKDHPIDNVIDDIIFASTRPDLCETFFEAMCSKFKMSMMGKLSIFLGLQIFYSPRGNFLNQSKYALVSLKKYGMETYEPVDTPMVEKSKLDEDLQGKVVDPTHYRGIIGTHMYHIQ